MEKIEIIKSIIYICLLIYSSSEISNNLNDIDTIVKASATQNTFQDFDLNLNINSPIEEINDKQINFTYFEFKLLLYKLIETFLYFNVCFMLLIFLSQNSGRITDMIRK